MKCINDHMCLCFMQTKTDNHTIHLNYRSIYPSSVAYCFHIIIHVLVNHWKTMDYICICRIEDNILQDFLYREHGPAFPEFIILILSEYKVNLMSSEKSNKPYQDLLCAGFQMYLHECVSAVTNVHILSTDAIKVICTTLSKRSICNTSR